jgi:hypothetical protein
MNPKLTKFVEEFENITLLGLFWAMYWRVFAIVVGGAIGIAFLAGFFSAL